MGRQTAHLAIHRLDDTILATWECSCGKSSLEPVKGLNIAAVIELGRRDYWGHCAEVHPALAE